MLLLQAVQEMEHLLKRVGSDETALPLDHQPTFQPVPQFGARHRQLFARRDGEFLLIRVFGKHCCQFLDRILPAKVVLVFLEQWLQAPQNQRCPS